MKSSVKAEECGRSDASGDRDDGGVDGAEGHVEYVETNWLDAGEVGVVELLDDQPR